MYQQQNKSFSAFQQLHFFKQHDFDQIHISPSFKSLKTWDLLYTLPPYFIALLLESSNSERNQRCFFLRKLGKVTLPIKNNQLTEKSTYHESIIRSSSSYSDHNMKDVFTGSFSRKSSNTKTDCVSDNLSDLTSIRINSKVFSSIFPTFLMLIFLINSFTLPFLLGVCYRGGLHSFLCNLPEQVYVNGDTNHYTPNESKSWRPVFNQFLYSHSYT